MTTMGSATREITRREVGHATKRERGEELQPYAWRIVGSRRGAETEMMGLPGGATSLVGKEKVTGIKSGQQLEVR